MKKIKIYLIILSSCIFTNCDKDFGEVNTDPNRPVAVPAHLLLGNIIRVNQNTIYNAQAGGDMGLCWSQQWSKVQYNDEERYIPRRGVIDGVWDNLYASVISDAKSMYTLAEAEENQSIQGISLVIQANAFQILTDLYGPVPFSEVFIPGLLKPKFDTQAEVYAGILTMLTDADALLASGVGEVPASSDLIYGGNVSKWRKLASSLKLKALMRISKKQNVGAQVQALVASGQLFSSNSDSAQLTYLAAQPDANPIYETIVFSNRAEYKNSSVLIEKLTLLNDPRIGVISKKNNANSYVGNIPGQENTSNYNGFSSPGTFYLNPTLPGVILSHAQVKFLLAEAANEGYILGGQIAALNYYNQGVQASMDFNQVPQAAATTYLAQPNIEFTTQADARGKIAEQTWISLYGQGFEAWTEWRRTGFPALTIVQNPANGVTSIPKRLFYPTTGITLNRENYLQAVSTLTGGDILTAPVWWMTN